MAEELIHQSAAAYALDALGPDEEREFEAHLAVCPSCQEEVASFAEAAAALGYAAPSAELPPTLRERILVAARDDRADVVTLRPRWAYPALVAAAVAACAAIGLGVWTATSSTGPQGQRLEALALRGAAGSVVVTRDGTAALVVSGLRPVPVGKTYELWVMHGKQAVPAGLFRSAGHTSTVHLTRRLPAGSFVGVTLEPAGGSPHPTTQPLFTSAPA